MNLPSGNPKDTPAVIERLDFSPTVLDITTGQFSSFFTGKIQTDGDFWALTKNGMTAYVPMAATRAIRLAPVLPPTLKAAPAAATPKSRKRST